MYGMPLVDGPVERIQLTPEERELQVKFAQVSTLLGHRIINRKQAFDWFFKDIKPTEFKQDGDY